MVLMAHYFASSDTSPHQVEAIADLTGDVTKGKSIFVNNCLSCHKIGGTGYEIGPDLTNIQNKFDKSVILKSIVNPDAAIDFGSEPYL